MKSLLEVLDRVPPVLCRMVAVEIRRGAPRKRSRANSCDVKRITVTELVKRSGIPRRSLIYLSHLPTWKGVRVEIMEAFSKACGVDLLHRNPLGNFAKRKYREGMPYFTAAQLKMFDELTQEKP